MSEEKIIYEFSIKLEEGKVDFSRFFLAKEIHFTINLLDMNSFYISKIKEIILEILVDMYLKEKPRKSLTWFFINDACDHREEVRKKIREEISEKELLFLFNKISEKIYGHCAWLSILVEGVKNHVNECIKERDQSKYPIKLLF